MIIRIKDEKSKQTYPAIVIDLLAHPTDKIFDVYEVIYKNNIRYLYFRNIDEPLAEEHFSAHSLKKFCEIGFKRKEISK